MQTQVAGRRSAIDRTKADRDADRYMDLRQAADVLHVSVMTVRRYLTLGRLKRYKSGGPEGSRTLVSREQVLSLIVEA